MKYKLLVNDPFHGDETRIFNSSQAAIAAAKKIVDAFLFSVYRQGMTASDLIDTYENFGEEPFIISQDPRCKFSAIEYAKEKAEKICIPRDFQAGTGNITPFSY